MKLGALPHWNDARRHGVYAAACAGLLAFSIALVWTATVESIRLPWYEPLERRFLWSAQPPSAVAMDFYARIAIAFAAAGVTGALAGWITAKRKPGDALLRAFGIWAVGITLLGMFLYAYALATRVIEAPLRAPQSTIESGR